MKMIKVTTYFKRQWSVTMLDTIAACPIGTCDNTFEPIFADSFSYRAILFPYVLVRIKCIKISWVCCNQIK